MRRFLICLTCTIGIQLLGQGIPYNVEFQVNSNPIGDQYNPQIAALSNGGYAVCWESLKQDGSGAGVYGQVFAPDGSRTGGEFRINTRTQGYQGNPMTTPLSDGGFAVCWVSDGQDAPGAGVYGQVFTSDGIPAGREFRVNTYTEGAQNDPKLISLPAGGFAVCWVSDGQDGSGTGIYGQVFAPDGTRAGQEFRINTHTEEFQSDPRMAALPGGGFAACWLSDGQDGSGYGVYGQVFAPDGNKTGQEFRINTYTDGNQFGQQIASLSGDGFIVCWSSSGQDGSGYGIYGQVFAPDGARAGQEFPVNTWAEGFQSDLRMASLPGGGFVVCWVSDNQDSSGTGISCQVFASDGTRKGGEVRVNTYTENGQAGINIATLSGGGFLICWTSYSQDGSWTGIYGQLYDPNTDRKGPEFRVNTSWEDWQSIYQMAPLPDGGFAVCWESGDPDGSDSRVFVKRFPATPVNHVLRPFELLDPQNGDSIKTMRPNLRWSQPSDQAVGFPWELHYLIRVDDNADLASPRTIEQDMDTTAVLRDLTPGTTYFWKVLVRNLSGDSLWSSSTNAFLVSHDASGAENTESNLPAQSILHPNYPNPFNPETTIRFELAESGFMVIAVYDVHGRLVRMLLNEPRNAGSFSLKWDGRDSFGNPAPSGIYMCKMEFRTVDGRRFTQSVKMGLVR